MTERFTGELWSAWHLDTKVSDIYTFVSKTELIKYVEFYTAAFIGVVFWLLRNDKPVPLFCTQNESQLYILKDVVNQPWHLFLHRLDQECSKNHQRFLQEGRHYIQRLR